MTNFLETEKKMLTKFETDHPWLMFLQREIIVNLLSRITGPISTKHEVLSIDR